jgi:ferredoxin
MVVIGQHPPGAALFDPRLKRTYEGTVGHMSARNETAEASEELEVWIDQDLCTGDGICAQHAPEVFELDIDGLAYVKPPAPDGGEAELLTAPGAAAPVPLPLLRDVTASVRDCPGRCIHVRRASDRVEVYGPDAE